MKQTQNGKVFEYSLLMAFSEITQATIQEDKSLEIAKNFYKKLEYDHKNILKRASLEVVLFLQIHDMRIYQARSIFLQRDSVGVKGDVRDIVIEIPKNQIGISAKYNHTAVKHSRLSDTIDFGKEWVDYPCSKEYFKTISPVFSRLRNMRTQDMFFRDIKDKDTTIYLPILIAFEDELKRLCRSFGDLFVGRLFRYLLGRYDFYKIILKTSGKLKSVAIQSVNIGGTLDYGPKWTIPNRIHSINRRNGSSSNTIEVIFDEGWNISFRLHNASSKVEPSLKFDIQFAAAPNNMGLHLIKIV